MEVRGQNAKTVDFEAFAVESDILPEVILDSKLSNLISNSSSTLFLRNYCRFQRNCNDIGDSDENLKLQFGENFGKFYDHFAVHSRHIYGAG